jgi:hypothetical protein
MTTIDDQGIILIMMKKVEDMEKEVKELKAIIDAQREKIRSLEMLNMKF